MTKITDQRKEDLLEIANNWANEQISSWLCEYGSWDDRIEDETLSDDELEWIQDNVKFNISVEEI